MSHAISLSLAAMLAATATSSPANAGSYRVVYVFGSRGSGDGASAYGGLINVGKTLYGTTNYGGAYNGGTVFALNPANGKEKVVYAFKGGTDGEKPYATLVDVGGTLYGTTPFGGDSYYGGTAFAVNPKTGVETITHAFNGGNDGTEPYARLLKVGGKLYGTTAEGGTYGLGTVFELNPATGEEEVVHAFAGGSDGAYASAGLIDVAGKLYGTTTGGGAYSGQGTVFAVTIKTGVEAVVHSFGSGGDGVNPYAAVINAGGILYGTTYFGGASNAGTVFALNVATGAETVVYAFKAGSDGANAYAAPTKVAGKLYGTTWSGGAYGLGTVFEVNPATGKEKVVHSFGGSGDGAYAFAGLLDVGGTLYGTTFGGGVSNAGLVFAYTP